MPGSFPSMPMLRAEPAHHLLHEEELLDELVHLLLGLPEPFAMRLTRLGSRMRA